jgi:hypothetical protein
MAIKKCGCTHNLRNRLEDACKLQKRCNDAAKTVAVGAGGEPAPLTRSTGPLAPTTPLTPSQVKR